ncbi:hypothetical protein CVT25_008906 [Psilocybe cyanescens]|uniref:Retrotransposon gag domain-containing protein n=1 Tax=Psilocybe cyanescens TaxID=93625 RepID=A0A409XL60_PSICY|nr:hypothetical protein CVT25_008906 [Psilocybe cyanescens]
MVIVFCSLLFVPLPLIMAMTAKAKCATAQYQPISRPSSSSTSVFNPGAPFFQPPGPSAHSIPPSHSIPPNFSFTPLLEPNPTPGLSKTAIHAIIDSNHKSTRQLIDLSHEANKDMVKEIVHSLLALPVFQHQPAPPSSTVPTAAPDVPKMRKYKVLFPKAFDSYSSSIHNFCFFWKNFLYSDPSAYTDITAKVHMTLSTFDDSSACIWCNRVIKDIKSSTFIVTSWEDFKMKFKDAFFDHYKHNETAQEISSICQDSRSTQNFLIEFKNLALHSELNDAALVQCLKHTLNIWLLYCKRSTTLLPTWPPLRNGRQLPWLLPISCTRAMPPWTTLSTLLTVGALSWLLAGSGLWVMYLYAPLLPVDKPL